jgi:putative transposase
MCYCCRHQSVGAGFKPAPTGHLATTTTIPHCIPEIIRAFKTFSSRRINQQSDLSTRFRWHRNYWEHIVRNEHELLAIRRYIADNPENWGRDKLRKSDGTDVAESPAPYEEYDWT